MLNLPLLACQNHQVSWGGLSYFMKCIPSLFKNQTYFLSQYECRSCLVCKYAGQVFNEMLFLSPFQIICLSRLDLTAGYMHNTRWMGRPFPVGNGDWCVLLWIKSIDAKLLNSNLVCELPLFFWQPNLCMINSLVSFTTLWQVLRTYLFLAL